LQTIADEGPYPSIVAGAVPFGAPVTVSWAEAGVAATRAQKAAVDRADIPRLIEEPRNLLTLRGKRIRLGV